MDVGITFVYVTHDQEEALTMSDRIAVMHRGRIEQLGTPEDLYDRPATAFVADFIGTTNLLSGTVEGQHNGVANVRLDSGDMCLVASPGRRIGELVKLSVRPESITLAAVPDGTESAGGLHGTVDQVAYLGASVLYHIRTHGGLVLSVLAGRSSQRFESGTSVELDWQPVDALVLGDRPANVEELR
jgi:spermidine/putrescine transport system ATP-binding protein